ncbi:hypothetical protein YB2330_003917 [Saitoella coloradoensis]
MDYTTLKEGISSNSIKLGMFVTCRDTPASKFFPRDPTPFIPVEYYTEPCVGSDFINVRDSSGAESIRGSVDKYVNGSNKIQERVTTVVEAKKFVRHELLNHTELLKHMLRIEELRLGEDKLHLEEFFAACNQILPPLPSEIGTVACGYDKTTTESVRRALATADGKIWQVSYRQIVLSKSNHIVLLPNGGNTHKETLKSPENLAHRLLHGRGPIMTALKRAISAEDAVYRIPIEHDSLSELVDNHMKLGPVVVDRDHDEPQYHYQKPLVWTRSSEMTDDSIPTVKSAVVTEAEVPGDGEMKQATTAA